MPVIKVKGMSCQHCVKSVTEAVQSVDGAINVNVDLLAKTATYDEKKPVDKAAVVAAITKVGFEAE